MIDAVRKPRKRIFTLLVSLSVLAALCGYAEMIGFPQHIRGHWVHKRIEWYEWGPGLPLLYPGVVYYVYSDSAGNIVKHGPYRRYVLQSGIRLQTEGHFSDGVPNGTFTEWNTYDGTKMAETFYRKGKEIGDAWYQKGKLFQYREDLFQGDKQVATKTFANGKWFLDKISACLAFTVDPRTGESRPLKEVVCQ
jgi:hypothetical protein